MMKRLSFLCALALLLSLLLASCAPAQPAEPTTASRPSAEELTAAMNALEDTPSPSLADFNALTLTGEAVTEELFAGHKLTMINIWGTFCNPCIAEMPDLARLNGEYGEGEFQVVGLIIDTLADDWSVHPGAVEAAWEIVDATGADYTHLLPASDLIYAALINVSAVPETIFVDSRGNILGDGTQFIGARSYESWKGIIDSFLASLPG